MLRYVVLLYGLACYAAFFLVFLYAVGFIGGFIVPTKLDGPATASLGKALAIDLLLVLLFALQHSVMARPAFKRQWTRLVPESAERSTYVLATCIALGLMFWFWQPLGGIVWDMHGPVLRSTMWVLFGIGWLLVLVATFLINHFDLFGLRQVWLQFRGQPYTPLHFATPGPYRVVRHPLYVGWLLVFWATPTMTAAHLLFAASLTLYILIAIRFEERDLVAFHPDYAEYRRRVPMLIPRWR
ncbi:MAG: methanethiol S-methyltransferase [Aureliella sp.]